MTLGLRRGFGLALSFAATSLALLAAAQVVNYFREPWLGIEPGYAPHNFAFNLSFYIPSLLLSSALAVVSALLYLRCIRRLRRSGARPTPWERATILPVAPVLVFDGLLALFLIRLLVIAPS
jgi:uncharacterized membrane protein YidH (DUF202 family)